MAHQMNQQDVALWRGRYGTRNVERWNHSRGQSTQTVRGSHVDISVRLEHWLLRTAGLFFRATAAFAAVGMVFVIYRIVDAFASGRVQQVLDAIQKASK